MDLGDLAVGGGGGLVGGLDLLGELGDGVGVGGVLGEVGDLLGVDVVVVELAALASLVPLGVAPAGGADAGAEDLGAFLAAAAGDLGDGVALAGGAGVFEEGDKAVSLEVGGRGDAAELGQGGVEIDVANGGGGGGAGLGHAGGGDDEGDAGAFLKEAHFLPEAVLAKVVAVVAGEDDDGVFGEVERVEGVEDLADLGVHEADAGEVGLDGLLAEVVGEVFVLLFVAAEPWSSATPWTTGIWSLG